MSEKWTFSENGKYVFSISEKKKRYATVLHENGFKFSVFKICNVMTHVCVYRNINHLKMILYFRPLHSQWNECWGGRQMS